MLRPAPDEIQFFANPITTLGICIRMAGSQYQHRLSFKAHRKELEDEFIRVIGRQPQPGDDTGLNGCGVPVEIRWHCSYTAV